jgi:4'-phosphopantetheinyl transferase
MNQNFNITDAGFQIDAPLLLPENEVHLWRADLDAIRGEESHWRELLSLDESRRADRFHFDRDRQRFSAARAVLRKILAAYLAEDSKSLNFCYSKKEKPSLGQPYSASGITFNISHSGGIALFAISRGRDVGVDLEQIKGDIEVEAIGRRFFSAHEQSQLFALPAERQVEGFFRCWTRKESYIKATGDGLSLPLSQFDVSLAVGATDALVATRPDAGEAERWLLTDVSTELGYAAALCVRGRAWILKRWSGEAGADPGPRQE